MGQNSTTIERAVWGEWNRLALGCHSPVKMVAANLGMEPADVAFIVYPAEIFGAWTDDQEPDFLT